MTLQFGGSIWATLKHRFHNTCPSRWRIPQKVPTMGRAPCQRIERVRWA